VFNEICKEKDEINSDSNENTAKPFAKNFFSIWQSHVKKQSKKEILEINNQLKSKKMNFLGAISNFSLPSTEDYQLIYNKAFSDIQKTFEKNTTIK
jgi:hypothetical protein